MARRRLAALALATTGAVAAVETCPEYPLWLDPPGSAAYIARQPQVRGGAGSLLAAVAAAVARSGLERGRLLLRDAVVRPDHVTQWYDLITTSGNTSFECNGVNVEVGYSQKGARALL